MTFFLLIKIVQDIKCKGCAKLENRLSLVRQPADVIHVSLVNLKGVFGFKSSYFDFAKLVPINLD